MSKMALFKTGMTEAESRDVVDSVSSVVASDDVFVAVLVDIFVVVAASVDGDFVVVSAVVVIAAVEGTCCENTTQVI